MKKINRIKQNIELHEKIVSMENTILDLNVNEVTHEVFNDNSKKLLIKGYVKTPLLNKRIGPAKLFFWGALGSIFDFGNKY